MIRIGECREKNYQLASAWSAYKDALNRVKDPRKKKVAAAKVAEFEPKLSYLTISVPDDSRVEGLSITSNGSILGYGIAACPSMGASMSLVAVRQATRNGRRR